MTEAYIVDAVRTAIGKRAGGLSEVHPIDLSATVLREIIGRTRVHPTAIDDVILGCVDQVGPQSANIARTAWLAAGLPVEVPGVTIDRQCGSSQAAVHFAAQAIVSGSADLVIAGGVQNMSMIPMGSAMTAGEAHGFASPYDGATGWTDHYGSVVPSQFDAAESIADRFHLSRAEMERRALVSHQRATRAIREGRFESEILPIGDVRVDEIPRANASAEAMAALQPLKPGGRITAATSSALADAASAVLVASEAGLDRHGLTARARISHFSVRGGDPIEMLTAPIEATRLALTRAGLSLSDIDLFEVNEAFASPLLAWEHELDVDEHRVNVNGGAMALGHPVGASGTRILTSLLNELERRDAQFGLQTMCQGGGQANVTIIERLA